MYYEQSTFKWVDPSFDLLQSVNRWVLAKEWEMKWTQVAEIYMLRNMRIVYLKSLERQININIARPE